MYYIVLYATLGVLEWAICMWSEKSYDFHPSTE